MTAVETVVADFTRDHRRDIWPRFTARAANVTTAEARDVMLKMVADGLLDLWYVVLCESGDEIRRYKHPETPPLGETVTCGRCEHQEAFEIEERDIYLVFSATDRFRAFVGPGDTRPKESGAVARTPAPVTARPDPHERASSSALWDGARITIEKVEINNYGDQTTLSAETVHGDLTGRDKAGGDQIGGDKAGGDNVGGDKTTIPAPPSAEAPKPKTAAAVITAITAVLAVVVLVTFVVLGITRVVEWKYALPAGLGGSFVLGLGALIAAQLRG